MKRKIVQILLCVLISVSLVGCKEEKQTSKKEDKQQVKIETQEDTTNETKNENKETDEAIQPEQEAKSESSKTVTTDEIETATVEEKKEEKQITNTESNSTEATKTAKEETKTQTPTTNTTTETPKVEEVPTVQEEPKATANDCKAVADKVLEYINSYRSTPATKLPGLTEYAEYRSRQLISNFAHDTFDERAAATALQYGTYIEPTLYGIEGEPYYAAGAREAIAKAGYVGTVDYVAEQLASLVKNSSGHWAYVGSGEYPYIAVGVTYESGMWYCDIAMARENTDNK